jgi:diadenosine tetraphosphate (Ap4A) HIT family hydrolase
MMGHRIDGCIFCNRKRGVIWQSSAFYLMLDDAPLVDGHSLLCPRPHYASLADIPEELDEQLEETMSQVIQAYRERYGPLTLFEHGRTGHCVRLRASESMCEHAHVHIVPQRLDLASKVGLHPRMTWRGLDSLRDLAHDAAGYVLIVDDDGSQVFFPTVRPLAPHYLRTVAAGCIGRPLLADWERVIGSTQAELAIERGSRRLGGLYLAPPAGQQRTATTPGAGRRKWI